MSSRRLGLASCLLVLVAVARAEPPRPLTARPAAARGTVLVPDRFLRAWDPVTIFFAKDAGPAGGGPEDEPARLVKLSPPHPGAWRWLDARTLQFSPADAWPALTRRTFTVEGRSTTLATLMEAPVSTVPWNQNEGLPPVDAITLTFRQPVETEALSRAVGIELRPLPGLGASASRWLSSDDFEVKAVERSAPSDPASYVLVLSEPVPLGTRAIVRLALSLDSTAAESFTELWFTTAQPFRVASAGCPDQRAALSPDGTELPREQALRCWTGERPAAVIEFTSVPGPADDVAWRNLVRFTPAVANLTFTPQGRSLWVNGDFARDTEYRLALAPVRIADGDGRPLEMRAGSSLSLWFPREAPFVKWSESQGLCERYGPRLVPVAGRGQDRLDLRIYPLDPLDRSFWPFPREPITIDESQRPPGPGEEPPPYAQADHVIDRWQLVEQLRTLGSPPVSEIVTLPLSRDAGSSTFGLDLGPHLAKLSGKDAPGTYLLGLRQLDEGARRQWMRIQVTDLCLSSFEEPLAVRFALTSLSTGRPVAGATVSVEGSRWANGERSWTTLWSGTTDASGRVAWDVTAGRHDGGRVTRVIARSGEDVLVLDPQAAPDGFRDGHWSDSAGSWLQWTQGTLEGRERAPAHVAHLFTERPVVRPDEPVHVKGWLRTRAAGRLTPRAGSGVLVVSGPGNAEYLYPLTLSSSGGFHHAFLEKDVATGTWSARFEHADGSSTEAVSFRIEAYRIPQFEVRLAAPEQAALDAPFDVKLSALYYAGGKVSGRPVAWRVTQFPYTLQLPAREGFRWSSDERYSGDGRFQSTPRLDRQDTTDAAGAATLSLNPAVEPTAQPRSYVVEATVTGPDDQTVTEVQRVVALPPFVLGVKAERYLERASTLSPEILAVGPDGKPLAGQSVTVRLLHRQWHSTLRSSDFTSGEAKYVTDVVDEKVSEQTVTTAAEAVKATFALPRAGVYVVEAESHDRLGRAQVVRVDLYAGGDEPVAWQKPVNLVFQVASDRDAYDPGQTAALTLKSPFQTGQALVVVEAPEGNRYEWLPVTGGAATYRLPVLGTWAPRVPVHFVLSRGRVPGVQPKPGSTTDLGRPTTMAATAWVKVNPVDLRVDVTLDAPERARPGQTVPVTVTLKDPQGRPLAGEVTLWLVDAAVLALGREQRLDPVPDFLAPFETRLVVRDTRNLVFGYLPQAEVPGGDQGATAEGDLLDRATVRKNFQPVPYYEPALQVDASGRLTVQVKLPDNLTVFKLRAKAASGAERFGAATGQVAVRLPVLVEPALPRFVRPGDSFLAAAIGRVVEGAGGAGRAEVRVAGATLSGAAGRDVTLDPAAPVRIEFPVDVGTPKLKADGTLEVEAVSFRVGVERASDQASDAFEVTLPIEDDRRPVTTRAIVDLADAKATPFPAVEGEARPGTVRRAALVSSEPGLVRMAAGLQALQAYPYGCAEQRISLARAAVGLRQFRETLAMEGAGDERTRRAFLAAQETIAAQRDASGLVSYWPGSKGYVSLTAWSLQLLVEGRQAGLPADPALEAKLVETLRAALRSDYGRFIDGESWAERAWALAALSSAGQADAAYAAELARKSQYLSLEGQAQVLLALSRAREASSGAAQSLVKTLWDGVVVRLHDGREIYGGLQASRGGSRSGVILPSETRTVAQLLRSLVAAKATEPKLPVLVDALVTLGRGDGWGSTNANAEALLALADALKPPFAQAPSGVVEIRAGGEAKSLSVGPSSPAATWTSDFAGTIEAARTSGTAPLVARLETRWTPAGDGSTVAADSAGFVVEREVLVVRGEDGPADRVALDAPGRVVKLVVGDVVEQHVRVVNPAARTHVAIVVPRAAGLEPLNPALATAPPEARPSKANTREPSYQAVLDDAAGFFFDELPAGTYDFWFRERATVAGRFVQPAATAELMYDAAVRGQGHGSRVEVTKP